MPKHLRSLRQSGAAQRGVGLIDALIALAILAFGMLGMTKFQANLVAQGTDAQARIVATQLADRLLNLAIVDPSNAGCYTLPVPTTCASASAKAKTTEWNADVTKPGALPGTATAASALVEGDTQLEVKIGWNSRDGSLPRLLTVRTDVRP